jgi:hypothetical protein
MEVQLPPYVIFRQDPRLMVWRPRGRVDEKAVNEILQFMGKEEAASDINHSIDLPTRPW